MCHMFLCSSLENEKMLMEKNNKNVCSNYVHVFILLRWKKELSACVIN